MSGAIGGGDDILLERLDSRAAVVWRSAVAGLLVASALGIIGARMRLWGQPAGGAHAQALVLPIAVCLLMLCVAAAIARKGTGKWPLAAAGQLALILYYGGRVPAHLQRRRRGVRLI